MISLYHCISSSSILASTAVWFSKKSFSVVPSLDICFNPFSYSSSYISTSFSPCIPLFIKLRPVAAPINPRPTPTIVKLAPPVNIAPAIPPRIAIPPNINFQVLLLVFLFFGLISWKKVLL